MLLFESAQNVLVHLPISYHFQITIKILISCTLWHQNLQNLLVCILTELQGDPNQNLICLLAITLKLCISDPMLVKPKCVWEASNFFDFQLFVYNFQLFVYNLSKKLDASQTHFGFTNIGSEMHSFRVIAKRHFKFWFGSPCKIWVAVK